jgi:hypothetical protein
VCYNGLVVPDYGMRRNHVGRAQGKDGEEAREMVATDTLEADDEDVGTAVSMPDDVLGFG